MSYILFLLGLPHILEARRACLHSQLARLEDQDGKEANEILGQLAELFELIKLLRGGKNAPFGASIPHDSLALYASGQDVAYKCSSPQCPGYPWPDSVRRHSCKAGEGEPGKVAEGSSPAPAFEGQEGGSAAPKRPPPKPILGVWVGQYRGTRLTLAVTELGMHGDQAGGSHLLSWINAPGGGRCVAVNPPFVDAQWILSQWAVTGPGGARAARAEAHVVAECLAKLARGERP